MGVNTLRNNVTIASTPIVPTLRMVLRPRHPSNTSIIRDLKRLPKSYNSHTTIIRLHNRRPFLSIANRRDGRQRGRRRSRHGTNIFCHGSPRSKSSTTNVYYRTSSTKDRRNFRHIRVTQGTDNRLTKILLYRYANKRTTRLPKRL